MKTITILSLVQTAILLILLGKIVFFEEESTISGDAEQYASVNNPFDAPSTDGHVATAYYPDENQLRQIIREELGAQLDGRSGPDEETDSFKESNTSDHPEYQYQRELVAEQLEFHTSVGSISDTDMQRLQGDIAKLDAAGQKEMLGRLTRALNAGQLDGRL